MVSTTHDNVEFMDGLRKLYTFIFCNYTLIKKNYLSLRHRVKVSNLSYNAWRCLRVTPRPAAAHPPASPFWPRV